MAICTHCQGEMTERISCRADPIVIDGEAYDPVRWGEEGHPKNLRLLAFCRDCATPLGGVHHPGCCVERCPACPGQAIGCRHVQEEEEYWDEPRCVFSRNPDRCRAHLFLRAGRS